MTPLRRSRLAVLLLVLTACAQASPLAPGMKAVEEIRGKKFIAEVRNVSIDRSELKKLLREQMEESVPYSLEDWGTLLRALQLVDIKSSEIVPTMLQLYESQVLAFYDPHSHTYYSIKQMPNLPDAAKLADPKVLEETVMVHELTHALQDQYFKLGPREKELMKDTDAMMAYHSVLEGEAVLVMVAHMLKQNGVELDEVLKDDAVMNMMSNSAAADQMIDPKTPKYFVEMLKFPYLDGLKFVITAYKRGGGWKAIDAVHANPPRSTREILHSGEYFAHQSKYEPFNNKKPEGDVIAVEHLGEFHWRYLVGVDAARGWINDRAAVWRDGRVETWTKWESPERASAFADTYGAFLKKRGIDAKIAKSGVEVTTTYTAPK
ncbi:MAG: hypothetical protein DMF56_04520 [Acidobacteria bacterium]|nr:MAG: hypothetical protein DMF56_04520 [Acidobacteriota bacterium]